MKKMPHTAAKKMQHMMDEGMPRKQAYAAAMEMHKGKRLDKKGNYKRKGS